VLCLLRCVALCCDPLCNCCVVSVELRCVVLRCLVLCCVVDKFSISSIPSLVKLYIFLVDILNQLHSLADNLYTRELDKLNHPYQIDKLNIFHLL